MQSESIWFDMMWWDMTDPAVDVMYFCSRIIDQIQIYYYYYYLFFLFFIKTFMKLKNG